MIDILISMADSTEELVAPTVDAFARILAVLGYVVTVLTFGITLTITQRSKLWKGRAKLTSDLVLPFDVLRDLVAAAEQDPSHGQYLWSPASGVAMQTLTEGAGKIPDRKLARLLNEFVTSVRDAKGDSFPTAEDIEANRPLSATRRDSLQSASKVAKKIKTRMGLIEKKAATA